MLSSVVTAMMGWVWPGVCFCALGVSLLLGAGKYRFLNTFALSLCVCDLFCENKSVRFVGTAGCSPVCVLGRCVCVRLLWADTGKNSNKTAAKPKE